MQGNTATVRYFCLTLGLGGATVVGGGALERNRMLDISQHPGRSVESSTVLGPHPTRSSHTPPEIHTG